VDWPAYIATLAVALFCTLPEVDRLGARLGWAFARPWQEHPPDQGICPGVAMPTAHSLTRTYGRPARLLFRYRLTERCWHCGYARPLPPQGWRARRPAPHDTPAW
jgi:hypothetical protein